MRMKIFVTGGAGYIGSHTTLALLRASFDVVVLDNFCNSSVMALKRVAMLAGRELTLIEGDVRDPDVLRRVFSEHLVSAVVHFAGLKAIGESVSKPLRYYDNNVCGSHTLLKAMAEFSVFNFVFSSSAAVYGQQVQMPISEDCPVGRPSNPYGRTKLMVEDILCDLAISDPRWSIAILRYFNPVGADSSGQIGEDPKDIPNNLTPYIARVANKKMPELLVFGNDYKTVDGTGVRDYVHVSDLAEGHICALEALKTRSGVHIWNLGTGQGYSVLDILSAFEAVSGISIPYRITPRRPGDIAICYADPTKARNDLGWIAKRGLSEMMKDAWDWQQKNPDGYR